MGNATRDRRKEGFWRRMVRGQARSGLAIRAWCRRHHLQEASFYWWRRQLARRDAVAPTFLPVQVRPEACASKRPPPGAPTFLPVQVRPEACASKRPPPGARTILPVQVRTETRPTATATTCATAAAGRLEIVLAGDCRVHVVGPVDRQALADVLAVLAGAPGAEAADEVRRPLREVADDEERYARGT